MTLPQYPDSGNNGYNYGGAMYPARNPGEGLGIAGFVLSLSLVSRSKSRAAGFKPTGLATAGLILSAISLVFMIIAAATGLFSWLHF